MLRNAKEGTRLMGTQVSCIIFETGNRKAIEKVPDLGSSYLLALVSPSLASESGYRS